MQKNCVIICCNVSKSKQMFETIQTFVRISLTKLLDYGKETKSKRKCIV